MGPGVTPPFLGLFRGFLLGVLCISGLISTLFYFFVFYFRFYVLTIFKSWMTKTHNV